MNNYKSQSLFLGFWSSTLLESFGIWYLIPRQVISKKIWSPNLNQPHLLYMLKKAWESRIKLKIIKGYMYDGDSESEQVVNDHFKAGSTCNTLYD